MSTTLMKRALPFLITLVIGMGLGNIFSFQRNATRHGGVSGYRLRQHRSVETCQRHAPNEGTQLKILSQPNTRYTPQALKNRTAGVVALVVRFNADGTTTVVNRALTLPDGLTEDAERVAEQTRFVPATIGGQPVAVSMEMNYIYNLSGNSGGNW